MSSTLPTASDAGSARVLIVEDDATQAQMIEGMLTAAGSSFTVAHVGTLAEAKTYLRQCRVACVLLDLTLPDAKRLDGLVELRQVSSEAPIVVVTADDDESRGIRAVQAGAQDYLMKGRVNGEQLSRAILYAIERQRGELLLAHRALHDELTGLPNRTLFLDRVALALAQSVRDTLSVAVLFLDLDGFKSVNDEHGHAAGDTVLQAVATRLLSSLRPGDTAARFGGDEFTMLTTGVSRVEDVVGLAERLVKRMATPFELGASDITLGASIGIALACGIAKDADAIVTDADEAMYRAKAAGRRGYALSG